METRWRAWYTISKEDAFGPIFPGLSDGPKKLCLGGGKSYSLFVDKDEFHRSLSVVYIKTCCGRETQKLKTEVGVDPVCGSPGAQDRDRGVVDDLLPFSLVQWGCRCRQTPEFCNNA